MKIHDLIEKRIEKVGQHLNKEKQIMHINKGKEKMVMERGSDHNPFQATFDESSDHNPFQVTSNESSDDTLNSSSEDTCSSDCIWEQKKLLKTDIASVQLLEFCAAASSYRRGKAICFLVFLDTRIKSRKYTSNMSFTLGYTETADNVKILHSCNDYAHDDSNFYGCAGLRLAFDPTKSPDYKVVHARSNSCEIVIQIYSSEIGNWIMCREWFTDYIGSSEFSIYKMTKGVLCGRLKREDDSFLVMNLSGMVVQYNLISKTVREIYDMRSNEVADDYFHSVIPRFAMYDMGYKKLDHKMTTSVVNTSVFKGFFEKQKLTGPNFIDWYRKLRIVLSVEDMLNYLEHLIPAAPVPAQAGQQVAPEALAAHAAWVKGSKNIDGLMLITMELEIQRKLENLGAYEMLQELKTLSAQQAEQELLQTMREFHSCTQEEGQSVSSYVLKMKRYIDDLERLGHPMTTGLGVSLILISLRKEFDGFVQNYNMHIMEKTINELHAMLKLHKQTLPKNNAPTLHAMRAGKVQKGINKHKKSSMYAFSNKRAKSNMVSALLWHCRLGHISKKCNEKLQQDGLLNSTDLRTFEKCVPCMSGKMARKPYSHQVERAKDLLGLLHTNHKHEVFETFKVFQKEVENQLEIDEPQNDIIAIRRSTRTRHALYRMCLYIDAEVHELRDLGEPANYKAALLDPESDRWLNAMNVEMQSMKYNKVWDLVDLHPNDKTVGSKWLFKKKTDMDGAVHTYKAHIRAIRILIAIVAFYVYEIWKMDVKTSFLNGYLSKEIYMEQPEDFVNLKYLNRTGYVFVLNEGAVDWKSAKQSIFATSSVEADYIAAFDASKEAFWVRKFIFGLGVVVTIEEPIIHYLREVIEYGNVKSEKVHTDDNLADPFTKALAFPKYSEHTKNIGMLPASSLM
nr:zinc finger, CCHC-type [Tanacetum cinerariifolium]